MLGFNDDIVLSGLLCDKGRDDMGCPNGGTSVLRSFDAEGNENWTLKLGATQSDSIGGARLAGVAENQMVIETDDSVDWIGPDGKIERTLPSPSAPVCVLKSGPVALSTSGAGQAPDPGTPATAVANGKPSEVGFQLLSPQGDQWAELPGGATKVSGTAPFGGCSNLDMTRTAALFEQVRDKPPREVSLVVADGDGELFACATAAQTSCQFVDSGGRDVSMGKAGPEVALQVPPVMFSRDGAVRWHSGGRREAVVGSPRSGRPVRPAR